MVPRLMIAAEVSPIDTPMAVTMPGHHRHSSMIGIIWKATALAASRRVAGRVVAGLGLGRRPRAFSSAICRSKRSRAMASMPKVGEQLAEDVVGREVAVLELTVVRHDLLLDEVAHGGAHHLLLVRPLEHGGPRSRMTVAATIRPLAGTAVGDVLREVASW